MPKNDIDILNMINAMALGDSLGFPYETMKPSLVKKINPDFDYKLNFKGFFKSNMITDDTEHLILTYLALRSSEGSNITDSFSSCLSHNLKKWFLTLPAGIGMATLKSLSKLTIGINPNKTGVFSAGNGPLMRAPIIGLYYFDNEDLRKNLVRISTKITHTDPLAELCAQSVADICSFIATVKYNESLDNDMLLNKEYMKHKMLHILKGATQKSTLDEKTSSIWQSMISDIRDGFDKYKTIDAYLSNRFPKGVSGFSLHTLEAVIAQLYYQVSIEEVVRSSIYAGGDTDTTAGISAAVFSILPMSQPIKNVDTVQLIKRMQSSYPIRFCYSLLGWGRSLLSLWRFIYIFKKS